MSLEKKNLALVWLLVFWGAGSGLCSFEDRDFVEQAAPAVRVRFKPEILVCGPEYTLGDMAEITASDAAQARRLAGLAMGKTPRLGVRQPLNSRQIESRLEDQGIGAPAAALEFPRRIFVEREGQDVDMKTLRADIEREVLAQIPFDGDILVENVEIPPAIRLPAGVLSHTVEFRLPRQPVGTVAFTLDLLVDGESQKRVSGVMRIDMQIEALRVEKGIKRGQAIVPASCKTAKWRLSQLRGTALSAEDFASPLIARRDLKPGDLLTWSNVERQKLVRRGEAVRMLLQTADGMRISALGRSTANGALGDVVEVANGSSGKRVQGIVVGRQLVQVPF